jgi:hypothetical protein
VFDSQKQQIAAVSRTPGNLDLFVIGFDNHVWTTFWGPRIPYNCAHCNDGSCQCGYDTPAGLCANHNGNDPTIGCVQEQLHASVSTIIGQRKARRNGGNACAESSGQLDRLDGGPLHGDVTIGSRGTI